MILFLLLSVQTWIAVLVSRRWGLRGLTTFLSVFLLVHANFVLTSYFLAIFSLMNQDILFFGVSVLFGGVLYLLSRRALPIQPSPAQFNPWQTDLSSLFSRLMFVGVVVSSLCFAGFLLYLGANTPLRVPDTLSVKLASSYYYLINGNFLGKGSGGEVIRLFSTPFNVFSMWITLIRFGISSTAINVYHFVCWLAMFVTVYLLGREISKSRAACLFAAFSFCGTLVLLMQGYLDFDDLPASVTATVGTYFFLLWLKDSKSQLLALAAIGVGFSFGAKVFPALYLPAVVLLLGWQLLTVGLQKSLAAVNKFKWQLLSSFSIFLSFALPYPIVRWIETGQFNYSSIVAAKANWPFDVLIAIHNLMIYNLQLLLFAVPDLLHFENSTPQRKQTVNFLNDFFLSYIPRPPGVSWLSGTPSKIFYEQIIDPDTWYGFVPLAVLLIVTLWVVYRRPLPKLIVWSLVFFLAWDIFLSIRGLYLDGMGRYWILPVSLLTPVLTLGWEWKFTRPLVYFTVLTTAYFSWSAFFRVELTNGFLDLKAAKRLSQVEPVVSKPLRDILQFEKNLNLVYNFGDLQLYNFFNLRHHLKLTTSRVFDSDKLNLYLASENPIENWAVGDRSFTFLLKEHGPASFCALGPDSVSSLTPVFAWPSNWPGMDCGLGIYSIVTTSPTRIDPVRNIQDLEVWVLQNEEKSVQIQLQFFDLAHRPLQTTVWSSPSEKSRLKVVSVPFSEVSRVILSMKYKGDFVGNKILQIGKRQ